VVLVAGVVLCNNLDFTLPDSNLPSDDSDWNKSNPWFFWSPTCLTKY
jgi:hypothetical protein